MGLSDFKLKGKATAVSFPDSKETERYDRTDEKGNLYAKAINTELNGTLLMSALNDFLQNARHDDTGDRFGVPPDVRIRYTQSGIAELRFIYQPTQKSPVGHASILIAPLFDNGFSNQVGRP